MPEYAVQKIRLVIQIIHKILQPAQVHHLDQMALYQHAVGKLEFITQYSIQRFFDDLLHFAFFILIGDKIHFVVQQKLIIFLCFQKIIKMIRFLSDLRFYDGDSPGRFLLRIPKQIDGKDYVIIKIKADLKKKIIFKIKVLVKVSFYFILHIPQ